MPKDGVGLLWLGKLILHKSVSHLSLVLDSGCFFLLLIEYYGEGQQVTFFVGCSAQILDQVGKRNDWKILISIFTGQKWSQIKTEGGEGIFNVLLAHVF